MLDEKLPDVIRGWGWGGRGGETWERFQPVFQDLCSAGKNKLILLISIRISFLAKNHSFATFVANLKLNQHLNIHKKLP